MKGITWIIFLTLLTGLTGNATAADKIGHIDMAKLLTALPEYAQVTEQLEKRREEQTSKIQAMAKDLAAKAEAFKSKGDSIPASEKVLRLQEISELEGRINEYRDGMEDSLHLKEQELLAPLLDRAIDLVGSVAKGQGYVYVLDSNQTVLIYSDESRDLLPLIMQRLRRK